VEEPESLLAKLERMHVVFEVAVVHRQPHVIQSERGEERGVGVRVEDVEEPVEERPVGSVTERPAERVALERLRRRIPGDEALHVHPAAETDPAQDHGAAVGRRDPGAARLEQGAVYGSGAGRSEAPIR
jgi:hypothetical protein